MRFRSLSNQRRHMIFRGFLYLLAGIAVAFSGFRALRRKRRHGERHRSRSQHPFSAVIPHQIIHFALLFLLAEAVLR